MLSNRLRLDPDPCKAGEGRRRWSLLLLFFLAFSSFVSAEIHDVTVTDVTTRAFSVAWFSDEPVLDATVRVFIDEDGLDEITSDLDVSPVAVSNPTALDLGLAKVDVVGVTPDSTYYFSLETTTGSGLHTYPASLPLESVTTAVAVSMSRAGAPDEPIVNDLILHSIFGPDGTTPGEGMLVFVNLPEISPYPISAFVGEGINAPMAMGDLGNLFDADGFSAEATAGAVLEIEEYRGNACTAADHRIVRLRRVPAHEEDPAITELEEPGLCFAPDGVSVDYDCDSRIGVVDFTRFLGNFTLESPDCQFNSDYDLDADGRVGLVDFTRFLSVFGSKEASAP